MNHVLDRFLEAQKGQPYMSSYETALSEIKQGYKFSHWMWYIFPQLRILGKSPTAEFYGIQDLDEAIAYLAHPILSARLIEISEALLPLAETNPVNIFGSTDAKKLRSCMTLFSYITEDDSVFHRVLDKFYNGEMCHRTLSFLNGNQ